MSRLPQGQGPKPFCMKDYDPTARFQRTTMTPKYPNVKVQLVGEDGNAYAIIGRVRKAMRDAGLPNPTITEFIRQASKGDYDHLLRTVMEWVEVS